MSVSVVHQCELCIYGEHIGIGIRCILPFPDIEDGMYCCDFEFSQDDNDNGGSDE